MKLMSYREALAMGKEKVAEMLIPVKVKRAKMQADLERCKIEENIATKQAKLHELSSSENVNFSAMIDLMDEIGLLERKLAQYQEIIDAMFPQE
jgi:hypothetical protein